MELGVNRKGKKAPPTTVKKIKANRSNSPSAKDRNLSKSRNKSIVAAKKVGKSNHRKPFLNTLVNNNSRLKDNAAPKKNPAGRSGIAIKSSHRTQITRPKFSLLFVVYAIAIIVGLSTILGTTVAIASSFQTPVSQNKTAIKPQKTLNSTNRNKLQQILNLSSLGEEINPLKIKLETLAQKYPELEPEVFLVDLDTKGFVSIRGKKTIASASTIKLPILVAFFQDLDRQKIQLEEQLIMTKDLIAAGSGDMQHKQPDTKFSALETAEKMIAISDNTATNMLIERLGGMTELNQRFMAMGLTNTQLSNLLPDLTGTNTTSPKDLGNLLIKIDNGELISLRSRDRLLRIMSNVENDTLLPQGLESDALIAHKTGNIKSVLADVGMVDMPSGKRYIASMLVKRPDNAQDAQEFIQKASAIAYQHFKNPQTQSFDLEEE